MLLILYENIFSKNIGKGIGDFDSKQLIMHKENRNNNGSPKSKILPIFVAKSGRNRQKWTQK
jgi:hypothetical protein